MSLLQMNFMSRSLSRQVTVNAIIPLPRGGRPGEPAPEKKPLKSMYLLHGIFGNYADWVLNADLVSYAERSGIAIFMPSGDNSFYVDDAVRGNNYGEFIGRELVEVTRDMFKLSEKPEDTCIAGLSMGGFGALRNGLKYHETFGFIAALSSALITYNMAESTEDAPWTFGRRSYYQSVFGDIDSFGESDNNPENLIKTIKASGGNAPKIYMACGTEDGLVTLNRRYRDFLAAEGIPCDYEEGPGVHDWRFWDSYIRKAIDKFLGK